MQLVVTGQALDRVGQAKILTQDYTEPFCVLRTSDKKEEPSYASKDVLGYYKGKADALPSRHESWQLA